MLHHVVHVVTMATLFLAVNVTLLADLDIGVKPIGSTKHLVLKDAKASVLPSRAYIHLKNLISNDTILGKDSSSIQQHVNYCVRFLQHNKTTVQRTALYHHSSKSRTPLVTEVLSMATSELLATKTGNPSAQAQPPLIIMTFPCHSTTIHFVYSNG